MRDRTVDALCFFRLTLGMHGVLEGYVTLNVLPFDKEDENDCYVSAPVALEYNFFLKFSPQPHRMPRIFDSHTADQRCHLRLINELLAAFQGGR